MRNAAIKSNARRLIQKKARVTLEKFEKEHPESSQHSVALKIRDWSIPPPFAEKKMGLQVKEINGAMGLNP